MIENVNVSVVCFVRTAEPSPRQLSKLNTLMKQTAWTLRSDKNVYFGKTIKGVAVFNPT